MGHCVHILFNDNASQNAMFDDVLISPHVEIVRSSVVRVLDQSSNSMNFLTNEARFIEFDFEVKTPFLSKFIRSFLDRYDCLIKDCEDGEDEEGVPPSQYCRAV